MDVLVFFASPRKNGFTRGALEDYLRQLKADHPDAVVTQINAYSVCALPCTACGDCCETDVCRFNDLDGIDAALRAADTVIIASPMYNYSVPAPMKAIIDRWQRYFEAARRGEKLFKSGRKGVLIMSCGATGKKAFPIVKAQLKNAFDMIDCSFEEAVLVNETDKKGGCI